MTDLCCNQYRTSQMLKRGASPLPPSLESRARAYTLYPIAPKPQLTAQTLLTTHHTPQTPHTTHHSLHNHTLTAPTLPNTTHHTPTVPHHQTPHTTHRTPDTGQAAHPRDRISHNLARPLLCFCCQATVGCQLARMTQHDKTRMHGRCGKFDPLSQETLCGATTPSTTPLP